MSVVGGTWSDGPICSLVPSRPDDFDHWVARPKEVSQVPSRLDAEDPCEGLVSRMWVLLSIAT